jgi:uncharacterized protein YndB with AHSA1/START domain
VARPPSPIPAPVVDDSTVTLKFTKINDNKTNISLSHVKFIDEKARASLEEGWRHILYKLSDVMKAKGRTSK